METDETVVARLKVEIEELRGALRKSESDAERAEHDAENAETAMEDAQRESEWARSELTEILSMFADYERGIRDLDEVRALVRRSRWSTV